MWHDDGLPGHHANAFFATIFTIVGVAGDCHIKRANHRMVIREFLGDCAAVGERCAQDQRRVLFVLNRIQVGKLCDYRAVIRPGDRDHLAPSAVNQLGSSLDEAPHAAGRA